MSNFENLKKQAKQVLKWHRERHWPIAEQLRTTLESCRELSDREILDLPFKLADAQQFVALRAGYDSWAELKRQEEEIDASGNPVEPVQLNSVLPNLFVSDLEKSCAFYSDKLGFDVAFTYGDPPFYGQIERDELRIALRAVDAYILEAHRTRRHEEELLSVMFLVDGIKDLYQSYIDKDVPMYQALRTEPWGLKSFIVQDPDGHLISFAEDKQLE